MPELAWTTPYIYAAGEVPTPAMFNGNSDDQVILETYLGLYGESGAFDGTAPEAGAPVILMQAGYANPTLSSGETTVVFPEEFPNGLLSMQVTPVSATALTATARTTAAGTSAAQCVLNFWVGTAAATGAVIFSWLAIGF